MREVMYGAYSGGSKPGMRCVKKGNWKLIEYEAPDRQVRETQLFNLAENPHELLEQNLANDPSSAEKLAQMRAVLLTEMRRLDDPYRFSNQPSDDLPPPPKPAPKKGGKKKAAKK
jgi:arylsulfatase A-like enzyme